MATHSERRSHARNFLDFVDRRAWQLWALSIAITTVLALAFAAIFYPAIRWNLARLEIHGRTLPQLVAGLVILIFLEGAYIISKQRQLNELRNFIISTYTESARNQAALAKDPLTGLHDRKALSEVLEREVSWVTRFHLPLTLVLYDICNFGKYNEREGNLAGDVMLKEFAGVLQSTARQTDTLLRHGADEFLCFLPRTDAAGGAGFARRVSKACRQVPGLKDLEFDFFVASFRAIKKPEALVAEVEQGLAAMKKMNRPGPENVPAGRPTDF